MQKKFRSSPSNFPVCKPELLRVECDFEQEVDKESIYGFPENLIDLANYLEIGQFRPMSGAKGVVMSKKIPGL